MTEQTSAGELILAPETSRDVVTLGTLNASTTGALVEKASEVATALKKIIQSQGLSVNLRGKEYVKCEGWTTLACMLGCTAREVATIEEDGVYIATVELVKMSDGHCVSRASAECGSPDEKDGRGNPIWAARPKYARRSMAQTRATAKACRLAFSWIMTLAGYQPTPAEEMQPVEDARPGSIEHSATNEVPRRSLKDIRPTAGVIESMAPERLEEVEAVYQEIRPHLDIGAFHEANEALRLCGFDIDDCTALWMKIDSTTRAAWKKAGFYGTQLKGPAK